MRRFARNLNELAARVVRGLMTGVAVLIAVAAMLGFLAIGVVAKAAGAE